MQIVPTFIGDSFLQLSRFRDRKFNTAIVQLEQVYERRRLTGTSSMSDTCKATHQFLKAHLYSSDFIFLVFGLTILAFSTRAFAEPGVDYGPWRPVVISLAGLLAAAMPLLFTLVLFPFHLIFRIGLMPLTGLNIIFSSALFSITEPIIPEFFYDRGILYFSDLFGGILVFYTLAIGFLQHRIHKKICFQHYLQRHRTDEIGKLVPADKRGEIISLRAQDHYVEIVTENGSHLHRMSMKTATDMAKNLDGLQVHRSHWIATSAMLSLEKTSDRAFVVLRDGRRIPVSKSKLGEVQQIFDNR